MSASKVFKIGNNQADKIAEGEVTWRDGGLEVVTEHMNQKEQ